MRTARLVLPIVAVLALGVAGCGGDDAPTKAEYIADGDALCTESNKQAKALTKQFEAAETKAREQKSLAPLAPALTEAQKIIADANAKFQGLEAPAGLEDQVAALQKELDKQADLTEQLVAAAAKNDEKTYSSLGRQAVASQQKSQKSMNQIGFKVCGRPAQS
jgi:uncharacterized lipoprotein YehR (DUF1307 family)